MPAQLLVDPKKTGTTNTTDSAPREQPAPVPEPARSGAPRNQVSEEKSFLRGFEQLPDDGSAQSVKGVWWKGTESYNDKNVAYLYFRDDGTLHYGNNKTDTMSRISEWRQRGNQVYLALNNRYSEWLLTVEGDTMSGQAQNCVAFTWTMRFTREG